MYLIELGPMKSRHKQGFRGWSLLWDAAEKRGQKEGWPAKGAKWRKEESENRTVFEESEDGPALLLKFALGRFLYDQTACKLWCLQGCVQNLLSSFFLSDGRKAPRIISLWCTMLSLPFRLWCAIAFENVLLGQLLGGCSFKTPFALGIWM